MFEEFGTKRLIDLPIIIDKPNNNREDYIKQMFIALVEARHGKTPKDVKRCQICDVTDDTVTWRVRGYIDNE